MWRDKGETRSPQGLTMMPRSLAGDHRKQPVCPWMKHTIFCKLSFVCLSVLLIQILTNSMPIFLPPNILEKLKGVEHHEHLYDKSTIEMYLLDLHLYWLIATIIVLNPIGTNDILEWPLQHKAGNILMHEIIIEQRREDSIFLPICQYRSVQDAEDVHVIIVKSMSAGRVTIQAVSTSYGHQTLTCC